MRTAVIGVGYLGRFHAHKYADLPGAELVAVVDTDTHTRDSVAAELGVTGFSDYRELAGKVDAVSVAVPTTAHYEVARFMLEHGIHVLVEKPITASVAQAQALIDLAQRKQCCLQVGHLERFNAAYRELEQIVQQPMFIESNRVAPFKPRGTDVSVVLDLMIHDIDIIQCLLKSPLQHLDASGVSVLSDEIDIANARLHFADGCVANVTASRVSFKTERRMRFFQRDTYVSVDFHERSLALHRKGSREMSPGIPEIISNHMILEQDDPLREEISAFVDCVRHRQPPLVTGEHGRDALATAMRIGDMLDAAAVPRNGSSTRPGAGKR